MQESRIVSFAFAVALGAFLAGECLGASEPEADAGFDDPIEYNAPYVSTPMEIVAEMLELAEVTKDDVVYDLGSGDGRIVIMAAKKYGARGIGLEIDPELVEQARQNARSAGVEALVDFRLQDLFAADFSDATVVTLYLLPETNAILRAKLEHQLRPGARIISHDFGMGDWEPDDVREVSDGEGTVYRLNLWRVPPA